MELMNIIISEGRTWPFEEVLKSEDEYEGYFLSHKVVVVRDLDDGITANGGKSASAFLG